MSNEVLLEQLVEDWLPWDAPFRLAENGDNMGSALRRLDGGLR